MKGYFRKRGCTCKKKRCTCGAKWSFTIDIGIDPATGKRKQKTMSGFNTRKEAVEKATEISHEFNQGTYINEKDITFKEFVDRWLGIYKKNVKLSTYHTRKVQVRAIEKRFKYIKIKDITRLMYQEFLDASKENLSRNTIAGLHGVCKMIFQKAIELKIIKTDPTEYAQIPKKQKTIEELEQEDAPKYLEKDELALLLKTAKEKGLDGDYVTFKTLAYTGLRIGELNALKWSDVDFKNNTLSISKNYYTATNKITDYQLTTPKNNSSKRVVGIDDSLKKDLIRQKKEQLKLQLKFPNNYHKEGFVFARMQGVGLGYPRCSVVVKGRMRRLLKLAGLDERLSTHSLRHTHTSLLAEAGVGLEEIMERLGHKNDSITRGVYLHVTKSKKKEAVDKFSALVNKL